MRDAAHRQRDGRQGGLDLERITIGLPPLAPAQVVVPLYGSIWRAVIREGDIGIHLCGKTGQGKTALAVLMQQHFGSQMDDRHLPTSWSTTENVLEELAFVAKLFVVRTGYLEDHTSINDHLWLEVGRQSSAQGQEQ